jgi:GTPase KRas
LREKFENHFSKISRCKEDCEKIPMVLVGTKCDLEIDRKIDFQSGADFAKENKIPFFETSAKIPLNIEESVFTLIEEIYKIREISKAPVKTIECLMM